MRGYVMQVHAYECVTERMLLLEYFMQVHACERMLMLFEEFQDCHHGHHLRHWN